LVCFADPLVLGFLVVALHRLRDAVVKRAACRRDGLFVSP
jgi:hypothetical protein